MTVNVVELKANAAKLGINLDLYVGGDGYTLASKLDGLLRNNPHLYPRRADYRSYNVYGNGQVLGDKVNKTRLEELKKLHPKAFVESVEDEAGYKAAREPFDAYVALVNRVFYAGLAYIYDVVDNPKFGKAYSIAYDRGHSAGYSEIANYFDDLVELIK